MPIPLNRLFQVVVALFVSSCCASHVYAAPFAYIANHGEAAGTVSVIDLATDAVVATIGVGPRPLGVAVNLTGNRVYVVNGGIDNGPFTSFTVSVIDTTTNTVIATVPVGSCPKEAQHPCLLSPYAAAVHPDGTRVYISNIFGNTVFVIDTQSNTVVRTIDVGLAPLGLTVHPAGTFLYVANSGFPDSSGASASISVIDTTTESEVAHVPAPGLFPDHVALSPDTTKLYVTGAEGDRVVIMDTASNTVTMTASVTGNPEGLAVTPDGTRLYVTEGIAGGGVLVLDAQTLNVTTGIANAGSPFDVGLLPDGTRAYAVNFGTNSVSVIDTTTNTVVDTISVGSQPLTLGGSFITPSVVTPTGSNVTVSANGVSVTFAAVSGAGLTTITPSTTGPILSAGFALGTPPEYFYITTTAAFTAPVSVCVTYDPTQFTDPTSIRLLHFDSSTGWTDVTTSLGASVVCGQVTSLSPFAVAQKVFPPPTSKVNVRFHYSANGSAGGWSGTATVSSSGSVSIGPQAMEGNLIVKPGDILRTGYDFTMPGSHPTAMLGFTRTVVAFQALCVSGTGGGTITINLPVEVYTDPANSSAWYPSGDHKDASVYQGSIAMPDLCGGGALTLKPGGTFSSRVDSR